MTATTHIEALERHYPGRLPPRLRTFLESGEHARYGAIEFSGYIRGPYELSFVADGLADVAEFALEQGIDDAEDVDWHGVYGRYLPFAALHHDDVAQPKMFLMIDGEGEHPVLLFDYEGWKLFPLSTSLDGFLAALPGAKTEIAESFRPDGE
jgi:hypothetical protein